MVLEEVMLPGPVKRGEDGCLALNGSLLLSLLGQLLLKVLLPLRLRNSTSKIVSDVTAWEQAGPQHVWTPLPAEAVRLRLIFSFCLVICWQGNLHS